MSYQYLIYFLPHMEINTVKFVQVSMCFLNLKNFWTIIPICVITICVLPFCFRIHKEISRLPLDCSLDYIKVWTGPSNVTEVCSYSPSMKLFSIGSNMTIVYHTQRYPILNTSMFVSFSHGKRRQSFANSLFHDSCTIKFYNFFV